MKEEQEALKFFFVIQGDCLLNIRDENYHVLQAEKLLIEGNYFGEIGLIYKCPRTADIVARNYVTVGTIHKNNFNLLLSGVKNLKKVLIQQVCAYN